MTTSIPVVTFYESEYTTTKIIGDFPYAKSKPDYFKDRAEYWKWKEWRDAADDLKVAIDLLARATWVVGGDLKEINIGKDVYSNPIASSQRKPVDET